MISLNWFNRPKKDRLGKLAETAGLSEYEGEASYEIGYGLAFTYILYKELSVKEVLSICDNMLRVNTPMYRGMVDGLEDLKLIDSNISMLDAILAMRPKAEGGDCDALTRLVVSTNPKYRT